MRSVYAVAALFARDANLTFGGGSATAETLRRQLVSRRGWVSEADFRLGYAASRLTPGTNLLALCTVLGWGLGGWRSAVIALFAASIPSAILVVVVAAGYAEVMGSPGVRAAVQGAVAVSVALILSSAWALIRPQLVVCKRIRAFALIGLGWFAYDVGNVSPLTVLVAAGLIGGLWIKR